MTKPAPDVEFICILNDGKYTYRRFANGAQDALRYGEKWRDLTGDNLVAAAFNKIKELEERIDDMESSLLDEQLRTDIVRL